MLDLAEFSEYLEAAALPLSLPQPTPPVLGRPCGPASSWDAAAYSSGGAATNYRWGNMHPMPDFRPVSWPSASPMLML